METRVGKLPQKLGCLGLGLILLLVVLGCELIRPDARPESGRAAVLTRLPTLTPTPELPFNSTPLPRQTAPFSSTPAASPTFPVQTAITTPPPTLSMIVASTVSPQFGQNISPSSTIILATPIDLATPLPTPSPAASDWSFVDVQLYADQYEEGLLLYGDLLNNTGATQELTAITATFYDAQGQVIAGADNAFDYWPVEIIPAGQRLPFELTVPGLRTAADFELHIEAQANGQTPHQDFEFLNLSPWQEGEIYCLAGQLRNSGHPLQSYLAVVAVFYDAQDRLVSFGNYDISEVEAVQTGQAADFEICVEPGHHEIARYDLRAWGE